MILLKLNKEELVTLSTFSRIDIKQPSPIASLGVVEGMEPDGAAYKKAFEGFKENGFIVLRDGEPTLAQEMEYPFMLLHQPQASVSIRNHREINVFETNYSFHSGFCMELVSDGAGDVFLLNYPHVLPSVGIAIRETVFGDLEFSGVGFETRRMEMSVEELLVIAIYMSYISMRASTADGGLTAEECYVPMDAIRAFTRYEAIEGFFSRMFEGQTLSKYLQEAPEIHFAMTSLGSRGLFEFREDEMTLTGFGKKLFDPSTIRNSFLIGEHLPLGSNFTTLNIHPYGYVLSRTVSNAATPVVELYLFAPDTDPAVVMKAACPVVFAEGFGDEAGYKERLDAKAKEGLQPPQEKEPVTQTKEPKTPQRIMDRKFCIKCGSQLPLEAVFCSSCGEKQP